MLNSKLVFKYILLYLSIQCFVVLTQVVDVCDFENENEILTQVKKINYVNCNNYNTLLSNCTCGDDFIDCNERKFYSIPKDLTKLPTNITRLLFAKNFIKTLDNIDLDNSSTIKSLDLRRNQIEEIKNFSYKLADSLEFLSFCGNKNLTDFNKINYKFKKLKHLQLNNLKDQFVLSDGVFTLDNFPVLSSLDLNSASLKYDKTPFNNLKLQSLRLDSNNLNNLPCNSLSKMVDLVVLNISNNPLNQIAAIDKSCLNGLKNLNKLYVSSINLQEENLFDLSSLVNLQAIDLSMNRFSKIPYSSLVRLTSLKSLKISVNEATLTTPAVLNKSQVIWPDLLYLDLSCSNVLNLPENAFSLFSTELSELVISHSNLQTMDKNAFADLYNLNYLDLSYNNLKTFVKPSKIFEEKYMSNFQSSGILLLQNNSLECNQDLEWLFGFKNNNQFDKTITCTLQNVSNILLIDYLQKAANIDEITENVNRWSIIGILSVLIVIIGTLLVAALIIKRKRAKHREQQYRYQYFSERNQDDGFDTDNIPVYRDCTVSLQIKESESNNQYGGHNDTTMSLTGNNVIA